ncbi:MAG TPA: exodeoxyribonuclease VII large subunit, partial [Burkholderiaceae bacterium]|nr:exodeoxyribonuclease VII large subunit [Burkholderiaceae bacterium]
MVESFAPGPPRPVWTVAQLVHEVADAVALRFASCRVAGEISGFARAASGHSYFNLKDADGASALLRCAMFRRAGAMLDFSPADGQLVELRGRVGVYEPRGELQFVVEAMQRAGAGALYERFLLLKAKLEAEGLFDTSRKRALPAHPRRIGVVTSLGAAALHDVLTTLARRSPQVAVIVYPSLVQGADAPAALAAAIARAGERAEVDTLIVCRGGGSLEDLWAFNDERVVRAIAASHLPVVCGVGHETDLTLADLAADLRAPTPTAAAELAAPARQACLDALAAIAVLMRRRARQLLDNQAQRLDRAALRVARPGQRLGQQAQALDALAHRLASAARRPLDAGSAQLLQLDGRLVRGLTLQRSAQAQRLDALAARLQALDPRQVLARG